MGWLNNIRSIFPTTSPATPFRYSIEFGTLLEYTSVNNSQVMKFNDIPKELQSLFLEEYTKIEEAEARKEAIDKKLMLALQEFEELLAMCREKSSNYAKTRARREELDKEIGELRMEKLSINISNINSEGRIYNAIEKAYKESTK